MKLISAIAIWLLVVIAAGAIGITSYQQEQAKRKAEAEAKAAAKAAAERKAAEERKAREEREAFAKKLKEAKKEASSVLSKIEECESAVTVGVSREDLSSKATAAQAADLQFSRSEYGKLMPDVTDAMLAAAQDYLDSCGLWLDAYRKAVEEWEKAYSGWSVFSGAPAPQVTNYLDDTGYQALWVKAKIDLARAREALNKMEI